MLVLDFALSHLGDLESKEDEKINIMFLSPKILSQSIDKEVIESLKRRYRYKLLSEILYKLETEDWTSYNSLNIINIIDVIYMAVKIYKEIPQSAFVNSCRKLQPNVEKNNGIIRNLNIFQLIYLKLVAMIWENFPSVISSFKKMCRNEWLLITSLKINSLMIMKLFNTSTVITKKCA